MEKLLMQIAYRLLGNGDGTGWDANPEYTRGVLELVADATGQKNLTTTRDSIRGSVES